VKVEADGKTVVGGMEATRTGPKAMPFADVIGDLSEKSNEGDPADDCSFSTTLCARSGSCAGWRSEARTLKSEKLTGAAMDKDAARIKDKTKERREVTLTMLRSQIECRQ